MRQHGASAGLAAWHGHCDWPGGAPIARQGRAWQGKRPLEGERHVRTDDFHGASGAEPEGGIPVHVKVVDGGGNDVYVADT